MTDSKPVLIWGAGAIGGVIAAYLARAGFPTIAVDASEAHVQAMQRDGIRISGPVDEFTQPVPAYTPDTITGQYDIIMLSVKAQHTQAAVEQLLPHLSPNGVVLSLQNGLNELRIAQMVGKQRSLCGFVNFAADYIEPGHILYGNAGALMIGEHDKGITPRLQTLETMLRHYHPDVSAVEDIWAYKWGKLAYGSLLFLTAVSDETIADSVCCHAFAPAFALLVSEVLSVARAAGVAPLGFDGFSPEAFASGNADAVRASLDAIGKHYRHSAKQRSGVYRDLAVRKRKTEIDSQIGEIPRIAQTLGMATPVTDLLIQYIHEIEDGTRSMKRDNLAEFTAEAQRA